MYQLKSKKRIFISQRTTRGTTLRLNFIWSFLLHTPALFWYHFILIFQKVHSLPSWSSIKNIHFSKFYPQQKKKIKKTFLALVNIEIWIKLPESQNLVSLSQSNLYSVCVCVCVSVYMYVNVNVCEKVSHFMFIFQEHLKQQK